MHLVALALAVWTLLHFTGCQTTPDAPPNHETVEIDGHTFHLELAADEDSRLRGLGGRTELAEDAGMLFVFPDAAVREFVMRDCLIDIDIIFLDAAGRITRMHAMTVEPPRRPDESLWDYESRLRRYSSGSRAQFAIELRGGWLEQLDLDVQDRIELDVERLKRRAQ